MPITADRPETSTAIRTDLGGIFVSLELSRSTWLITSLSPGGRAKMSKHSVRGGDVAGLLERFKLLQEKGEDRQAVSGRGDPGSRAGWLLDTQGAGGREVAMEAGSTT